MANLRGKVKLEAENIHAKSKPEVETMEAAKRAIGEVNVAVKPEVKQVRGSRPCMLVMRNCRCQTMLRRRNSNGRWSRFLCCFRFSHGSLCLIYIDLFYIYFPHVRYLVSLFGLSVSAFFTVFYLFLSFYTFLLFYRCPSRNRRGRGGCQQ